VYFCMYSIIKAIDSERFREMSRGGRFNQITLGIRRLLLTLHAPRLQPRRLPRDRCGCQGKSRAARLFRSCETDRLSSFWHYRGITNTIRETGGIQPVNPVV